MPKLLGITAVWVMGCFLITSIQCIISIIKSKILSDYLKRNDYEKWKHLTSIGQFGPGLNNPFRGAKYLFDNKTEADADLELLKNSAKNAAMFALLGFSVLIVSFLFMILLSLYYALSK